MNTLWLPIGLCATWWFSPLKLYVHNNVQVVTIELQVNWNDNSGGKLKPARFSFSEFWVELLNAKDWDVYQIEAIKKLYLV